MASFQVDVANAKENSPSFRSIDQPSPQRMAFELPAYNKEMFVVLAATEFISVEPRIHH